MDDLIWVRPHSKDGSVLEVADEPRPKSDGWAAYVRLDTYVDKLEADKAK